MSIFAHLSYSFCHVFDDTVRTKIRKVLKTKRTTSKIIIIDSFSHFSGFGAGRNFFMG